MTDRPRVLFVCTHNAGRSALAAALARAQFGNRIDVGSAGVNPQAAPSDVTIASLAELGIDDSHHIPTALTPERVAAADVVVAMKPGLDIPQIRDIRYETWSLPDPSGWDIDSVRALRDDNARQVNELAGTLETPSPTPGL